MQHNIIYLVVLIFRLCCRRLTILRGHCTEQVTDFLNYVTIAVLCIYDLSFSIRPGSQ